MTPLFGPSRRDRDQLVHTLRPLGATSVGRLAAELGWSPRKTVKVIGTLYAEEFPGLHYDPVRGLVQVLAPPAAPPDAGPPDHPAPSPTHIAGDTGRPWVTVVSCPTCHVGMTPAGTGATMYCPQCGRLSTGRTGRTEAAPAIPQATAPPPTPSVSSGIPAAGDRRAQELFAAWVTAQPIECPKCRTSLQHRGVGLYACPACGHKVTFPVSPSVPAPLAGTSRPPAPVPVAAPGAPR